MFRPVLASFAALFLAITPALAQTADRTLTVFGTGEVQATPDSALVTVGVNTDAETAAGALQANSTAMTKVLDAIRAFGIDSKDVQTSGLSLDPRYSRPGTSGGGDRPRILGYTAGNEVTVRARDLSRLGNLLDRITTTGANRIAGIQFLVSNQDALLDEARRKAVADARKKAELFAQAGGFGLGEIRSLTEESTSTPRPMMRAAMAPATAIPVESGEVTLSARVRVVWGVTN